MDKFFWHFYRPRPPMKSGWRDNKGNGNYSRICSIWINSACANRKRSLGELILIIKAEYRDILITDGIVQNYTTTHITNGKKLDLCRSLLNRKSMRTIWRAGEENHQVSLMYHG
jgi:hypothetical protein